MIQNIYGSWRVVKNGSTKVVTKGKVRSEKRQFAGSPNDSYEECARPATAAVDMNHEIFSRNHMSIKFS